MAGTPGQPPIYTAELADAILVRIADGESLRSICNDPEMPSRPTVYSWVLDNKDGFFDRYARAREMQAHALVDDCVEVADDGINDWMERNDPNNPGYAANGEHMQRSRLRVDTRKWTAARILPKVYGDRVQTDVNHSGAVTQRVINAQPMTAAEWEKHYSEDKEGSDAA